MRRLRVTAPLIFWTCYVVLMLTLSWAWIVHADEEVIIRARDNQVLYPDQSEDYVPGVPDQLTQQQATGIHLTCAAQVSLIDYYLKMIRGGATDTDILLMVEDTAREVTNSKVHGTPAFKDEVVRKTIDLNQLTVAWLMLSSEVLPRRALDPKVYQMCERFLIDSVTHPPGD